MLVELGLVEQRHKAVLEVLDWASVIDVAIRNGMTRQGFLLQAVEELVSTGFLQVDGDQQILSSTGGSG